MAEFAVIGDLSVEMRRLLERKRNERISCTMGMVPYLTLVFL